MFVPSLWLLLALWSYWTFGRQCSQRGLPDRCAAPLDWIPPWRKATIMGPTFFKYFTNLQHLNQIDLAGLKSG
jgi:hypothetical protein